MLPQAIAIFLVLGLLFATLWFAKRKGLASLKFIPRSKANRLRVVEYLALTPQHSLHFVSINGRLVLFSASPDRCQVVDPSVYSEPVVSQPSQSEAASC